MSCEFDKSPLQTEYEYIAHQINREDGLVNNRMTWVLQLNGFLFAALALVAKDLDKLFQTFFSIAVPSVGIAVTFAGIVSIRAAQDQIKELMALWSKERFPDWPRPFGQPDTHRLSKLVLYLPLWALLASWSALLFRVLMHGSNAA